MIEPSHTGQDVSHEYRDQLDRLAMAMSLPNREQDVAGDLCPGMPAGRVKMFVDGNLDKRVDKLTGEMEFVRPAFDDIDELIIEYIRSEPLASLATSSSDAERMAQRLLQTRQLTAIQKDYLVCQQARHQVEQLARAQRLEHVQFQDLCSLRKQFIGSLETDPTLRLCINPLRVWKRFETAEFLDGESPPADVVFFADGPEIATAVIEPMGRALLKELASLAPCAVDSWIAVSEHGDRDDIFGLVPPLTELGLVALG